MEKFYTATDKEIKEGLTTDIYFERTRKILKKENVRKHVAAEFTLHSRSREWAVFAGLEEMIVLLRDLPVDLYALPEGTIFSPFSENGVPVPVAIIEGHYDDFGIYETPCLGLICQASGIATRTARMRIKAEDKHMLSFGIRRMHPAIAPMIERNAFIGGCDGVSGVLSAERINEEPQGTMPHALLLLMGDEEGWEAYDSVLDPEVPRVALIDTFDDEKFGTLHAAETFDGETSVRLDTPHSRKGDFIDIIRETRWELDLRGYEDVKIFVSGGLTEDSIEELVKEPVEGFGVGTSISNAASIDYSMDIVAIEGEPVAKRGKFSGRKDVYRKNVHEYYVYPQGHEVQKDLQPMLVKYLDNGELVEELPTAQEIRAYVMEQLPAVKEKKE